MEYLMTYGWAILVVVIVGIVLWQSGVFGTTSGGTSGFDKLRVVDYSTINTTAVQVVWQNTLGQNMRSLTLYYGTDSDNVTAAANLAPGKTRTDTTYLSTPCTSIGSGEGWTLDVILNYTSEANIVHSESGTIRGRC